MAVAVMQPYLYPYLGYFQMLNAVDHFVFYDDVNFIKGGWINRNRILVNGKPKYFIIQLVGVSPNKLINEVKLNPERKFMKKQLKMLEMNYSKAPFFNQVFPMVEQTLRSSFYHIGELSAQTVIDVANYLDLSVKFHFSSNLPFGHGSGNRTQRLIDIVKGFSAKTYINAAGGKELYSKEDFAKEDIILQFIEPELQAYQQNAGEFIPGLSIIDVLMHNSQEEVHLMLNQYRLI